MGLKLLIPLAGGALLCVGVFIGRLSVKEPVEVSPERPETSYRVLPSGTSIGSGSGRSDTEQQKSGAKTNAGPTRLFGVFNTPNGNTATIGFYETLRGMSSDQIGEMLADVDAFPNHARRRETRERLIDYLTMIDPLKALELREVLPGKGILGKSFKQLGRNGLSEAVRIANQLEDAGDRKDALVSALVGASEIDPVGAFASLKGIPGAGPSHYHEVFDNWAETDPEAAARSALTVQSAAERRAALKIVGQEWAEHDPGAVLDWIKSAQLSSYERENIRGSAIKSFAKRDPVAALELLSSLDAGTRARMLPDTIEQLARKNPKAAIQWIRDEPSGYAKSRAVEESIRSLADKAPEETIQLARDFPEFKDKALGSAFGRMARNDLSGALEALKEWEGDAQYSNALQNVAWAYQRDDPDGALAWAMELPEQHKPNVLSSIISNMANDNPHLAIKHLEQLATAENQPYHNNAVQNIASTWARSDPVAAAEWLQALPESDSRNNGLQQVAERWVRVDPVSASEWIGSLPGGQGRDNAAMSLINNIRNEDPEMAVAWSESLSEPSIRDQSLYRVYSEWLRHDRDKALQSLANSPISDSMKRNLVPELREQ